MIKKLKEDCIKIHDGIEDVLDDTVFWPLWYMIKGHVICCIVIYWVMLILAYATNKQWDLVERGQ